MHQLLLLRWRTEYSEDQSNCGQGLPHRQACHGTPAHFHYHAVKCATQTVVCDIVACRTSEHSSNSRVSKSDDGLAYVYHNGTRSSAQDIAERRAPQSH
eukprot:COSAG01_NODE_36753_length_512_cov_490.782082_1_plen_98_part_10